MFESANKCCISCLWFCLCNLRQVFQLVALRAYQFLSVFAESTFISNVATRILLPSVLLLILVPPKTSRAFSSPVRFMTSHDFEAFGLYPNLGPSLIFLMNRFLIWKISQNIQCNMTLMLSYLPLVG